MIGIMSLAWGGRDKMPGWLWFAVAIALLYLLSKSFGGVKANASMPQTR